ncbi:MAG: 4-hydroxythreonine-4-phosphate dehydrogenase PdxA [Rhodothermales bacterium]|nr:4-hydroxythreonine-4-phosphate dehydrogenase PdxA [Rhodothermales bacterium]MBO6780783.1 4-hydroxythreonine-4-phosphate dehydrogenase PdxA [Rhodothermales bacterium]
MGDPNGVGPEVTLKCLADPDLRAQCEPVIVGSRAVLSEHARVLGMSELPADVLEVRGAAPHTVRFGAITSSGGDLSMRAVAEGVRLCRSGTCAALVTAPISKEAIGMAGYSEPGHTEYLSRLCDDADHIMMMVAGTLRVGVVTGHIPLGRVAASITRESVIRRLRRLDSSLKQDFGIAEPRIAVLGLNPHAGDGGVLGREELDVIMPAMEAAQPVASFGPFPADGFFAERRWELFDAVLAMYHDQGLIPFKTLAFDSGVNFTAGLPIVRTSPDHGTAYDIAGTGRARPDSMMNALKVAIEVAAVRREAMA